MSLIYGKIENRVMAVSILFDYSVWSHSYYTDIYSDYMTQFGSDSNSSVRDVSEVHFPALNNLLMEIDRDLNPRPWFKDDKN